MVCSAFRLVCFRKQLPSCVANLNITFTGFIHKCGFFIILHRLRNIQLEGNWHFEYIFSIHFAWVGLSALPATAVHCLIPHKFLYPLYTHIHLNNASQHKWLRQYCRCSAGGISFETSRWSCRRFHLLLCSFIHAVISLPMEYVVSWEELQLIPVHTKCMTERHLCEVALALHVAWLVFVCPPNRLLLLFRQKPEYLRPALYSFGFLASGIRIGGWFSFTYLETVFVLLEVDLNSTLKSYFSPLCAHKQYMLTALPSASHYSCHCAALCFI